MSNYILNNNLRITISLTILFNINYFNSSLLVSLSFFIDKKAPEILNQKISYFELENPLIIYRNIL